VSNRKQIERRNQYKEKGISLPKQEYSLIRPTSQPKCNGDQQIDGPRTGQSHEERIVLRVPPSRTQSKRPWTRIVHWIKKDIGTICPTNKQPPNLLRSQRSICSHQDNLWRIIRRRKEEIDRHNGRPGFLKKQPALTSVPAPTCIPLKPVLLASANQNSFTIPLVVTGEGRNANK